MPVKKEEVFFCVFFPTSIGKNTPAVKTTNLSLLAPRILDGQVFNKEAVSKNKNPLDWILVR
ncbi:MAG TPA: hypothetical protein VGK00_10260 [Anaerolineales bacterium]|jgi:hypothetical protein